MLQSVTRTLVLIMLNRFNGHPPLGVNATWREVCFDEHSVVSFNGHPPLGVNATDAADIDLDIDPFE